MDCLYSYPVFYFLQQFHPELHSKLFRDQQSVKLIIFIVNSSAQFLNGRSLAISTDSVLIACKEYSVAVPGYLFNKSINAVVLIFD